MNICLKGIIDDYLRYNVNRFKNKTKQNKTNKQTNKKKRVMQHFKNLLPI